jgi:hypothetical protein
MLRSKEPSGIVTSGNLLKRVLLELKDVGELLMFCSRERPDEALRRAHVYQFAPTTMSSSRSERPSSARQPFRRRSSSRQLYDRWPLHQ